jgi:hypothetical protein
MPLVLRMREQIDRVFVRYVGPIAVELSREEFDRWCLLGQTGPSALSRYITQLAGFISEDAPRRKFITEANACIRLTADK